MAAAPLFLPHRAVLLLVGLLWISLSGCSLRNSPAPSRHPTAEAPVEAHPETPSAPSSPLAWLSSALGKIPLFHRQPAPPKALGLQRIGTVRTLSNDGTYVIVELEPGMPVSPGNDLLITATGGEPARLKVSEVQAPYFVADVVSGHPSPGDPVQQ